MIGNIFQEKRKREVVCFYLMLICIARAFNGPCYCDNVCRELAELKLKKIASWTVSGKSQCENNGSIAATSSVRLSTTTNSSGDDLGGINS